MTDDRRDDKPIDLSPFAHHIGAQLVVMNERETILEIVTEPHHLNPMGMIHGGVLLSLADNTATAMANAHRQATQQDGKFMIVIDLHSTFLSNQPGGTIRTEARVVRAGRRVAVIRTQVLGDDGRLLAEVTTTHIPA